MYLTIVVFNHYSDFFEESFFDQTLESEETGEKIERSCI